MMNRTLTLFLFLWNALILHGQGINYSFTQLSIEQGLSQPSVQSILLDRDGILWIGTGNGLNYYTQQGIKHYFHNPEDKSSLPDNHIHHITEDATGNLWVATSKGLVLYDKEKEKFGLVSRSPIYSSLPTEGGILFGGNNVLYRYDYREKNMERVHIYNEQPEMQLSEYRIQEMCMLEKDKILIGTKEKGLFLYDCPNQQFTHFSSDSHHLLISLYLASDSLIYASFYGDGLYCYDKNGNRLHHYTTANSHLNSDYILDAVEHKGALWLGTDGGGINMMQLDTHQFSNMRHIAGDNTSLPGNSIITLYKDSNEELWAGSVRGGIFNIRETFIKTYKDVALNNTNGLSEKAVIALHEEKDGKLWIGTDGGGINFYDPHTDKFTHFPSTYNDKVASIARVSDQELMVSLYTKGIFLFDKHTGTYRPFTVVNDSVNYKECFYGYLPLAHQVADDKIYLISYSPWVYHTQTRTFSKMHTTRPDINTEGLRLTCASQDFSLLKRGNQAFIVPQKTDSISLLFETDKQESIVAMSYDEDHTIWIGTDKGLMAYDLSTHKLSRISTKLFSNISFLIADGKDRIWICSQNALFSYHPQEHKFILWNNSDGFLPNEVLFSCQPPLHKDYLYLGGAEGLVKINTRLPYPDNCLPEINLADIHFNGSSYKEAMKDNRIRVPWNYNSLSLRLRIKTKDIFQKNMLKYTITGQGKQSIESYNPELDLPALSPGKHEIWVSCYTKDGNYTTPIKLIEIIILPPWYKSGWFLGLCILLFVLSALGISHFIYRKREQRIKGRMTEFLQSVLYGGGAETKEEEREDNEKTEATENAGTTEWQKKEETSEEEAEVQPVQPAPAKSKENELFIAKLNKLIGENLSNEELSIKYLTDHMAMSRASLYNKVRQATGMGVND